MTGRRVDALLKALLSIDVTYETEDLAMEMHRTPSAPAQRKYHAARRTLLGDPNAYAVTTVMEEVRGVVIGLSTQRLRHI